MKEPFRPDEERSRRELCPWIARTRRLQMTLRSTLRPSPSSIFSPSFDRFHTTTRELNHTGNQMNPGRVILHITRAHPHGLKAQIVPNLPLGILFRWLCLVTLIWTQCLKQLLVVHSSSSPLFWIYDQVIFFGGWGSKVNHWKVYILYYFWEKS